MYSRTRPAGDARFSTLQAEFDGHEWTVKFPVYIDCTYQQERYDEHGVARHGYAADAPFIDTPRQARYHYHKRFGIESSYRLGEQTTASTTTQDPATRLLFVVVSLLLQNVWRGRLPPGIGSQYVHVISLEDLVDVGIDMGKRVIHDPDRDRYAVIDGEVVYWYGDDGWGGGTTDSPGRDDTDSASEDSSTADEMIWLE